ncbi:hypothetical protein Aca07nite_04780 [Actinoplanes capillaceus]|uniref:Lipoprotein n=1 Tax=Actinoplanes campanulatus TaxID=113559 RepID=A0ABQ3WEP2_9ACTN|nr:hypothetical protein [Actinoplanes capillaceus]GID43203.1 hypothetical protein Aca07nite_04780 [Actinoplanes capillaceus]
MRALKLTTAAILALAVSGCGGGETTAPLFGYRTGPGDREITILFVTGPGDEGGRLEILDEDPVRVAVRVLYRSDSGDDPSPLIGVQRTVSGVLDQPLDGRWVVDQDGVVILPG